MLFAAALSLDEGCGPTYLKLDVISRFTSRAIGKWTKARLRLGPVVLSNGPGCFSAVTDTGCVHIPRTVDFSRPIDLPEFKWINIVLGNLQTTRSCTLHVLKYRKYGQSYPAAFGYCFSRRFDLHGLVATLIANVARSQPVQ